MPRYEHFKKQAKNLHRLLPEFVTQHPDGARLSDVQELLARTLGYPSLHVAQAAMKKAAEDGWSHGAD